MSDYWKARADYIEAHQHELIKAEIQTEENQAKSKQRLKVLAERFPDESPVGLLLQQVKILADKQQQIRLEQLAQSRKAREAKYGITPFGQNLRRSV